MASVSPVIFENRLSAIPLTEYIRTQHHVYYYMNLVHSLGIETTKTHPYIYLSDEERHRARHLIHSTFRDSPDQVIGINPGASYGPAKRWPAQNYARLADLLQEKVRATILIIGSLDEAKTAGDLSSAMTGEAVNLTGQTSLRLLAGLISLASLFISNDSGPMHLANALRVPVVALFGPSDPLRTRPFQQPSTVLKKDVPCWPCSYRVCPFDHRCMMNITPEEAYEAGVKYLG